MAIIHVTGNPRAGKTSFVVAEVVTEDMQYQNSRYYSMCKYIKEQKKRRGVARTLPPQKHVVSGNLNIHTRYPTMFSYPMTGWEFGAPNDCHPTKALLPYGVYVFDEAQRYFDSKGEGKELPPWVTQGFELHGQIFIKCYLITQRPVRLHKDIRAICERRIHIEKSIHTYLVGKRKVKAKEFLEEGILIHTQWYGREFASAGEHEMYVDGTDVKSRNLGKKFTYEFKGDIREHYNPYQFAVEMEDLNKDFNYLDYEFTERPEAWTNYKKTPKKDGKKDGQKKVA